MEVFLAIECDRESDNNNDSKKRFYCKCCEQRDVHKVRFRKRFYIAANKLYEHSSIATTKLNPIEPISYEK